MAASLHSIARLAEDEDKLSKNEFKEKINARNSIMFYKNKTFDIDFNDNNILGGHSIIVSISNKFKIKNIDIARSGGHK